MDQSDNSAPSVAQSGVTEQHGAGEFFFGPMGPILVKKGWSVFPQSRTDRRGPGLVDGHGLKWKEYASRLPTASEVSWWALQCPMHNVAAIMGKASGEAIALDLDIGDPKLSMAVQALADEHLGVTNFRRTGRHPRIVFIYRQAPEEQQPPGERIPSRSFRFVEQDPATGVVGKSEDGIEILSRGKPVTFYGNHHKTGRYFRWSGLHPMIHGPEMAPLVTQSQVIEFLEAVQALRPFHRNASAMGVDTAWETDDVSGLTVPRFTLTDDREDWVEDGNGIVVDGRETFLTRLVWRIVTSNEAQARDDSGKGPAMLKQLAAEQFKAKAEMSGKWDESYLRSEVNGKVPRAIASAIENNSFARKRADGSIAVLNQAPDAVPFPESGEVDDLAYIYRSSGTEVDVSAAMRLKRKRLGVNATFAEPEADLKTRRMAERALEPDRTQIAAKVQSELKDALDAFFDEVYGPEESKGNLHLLRAPTGAGKTSQTIAYIARDERTKSYDTPSEPVAEGEVPPAGPGPIVMLLPTYNNIEELRTRADVLNLDKGQSDEDLVAQALERGLVHEDQIEARIADLRREASSAGLRTMIYRGKANAGCQMHDKLGLLMQAGIGTAGLCRATVQVDDDEKEERFCVHYHGCPAITQRKEIAKCHVVFMPHAFLTLTVPEELQAVRCVIADERVFHLFLHTAAFNLATLRLARREPKLYKKEREEGMLPQELLRDRDTAADKATEALKTGRCPARLLADMREVPGAKAKAKAVDPAARGRARGKAAPPPKPEEHYGRALVKAALRVCSNAISASMTINPDMSMEDVKAICESPTGVEVREEARFWKIVDERMELLIEDDRVQGLVAAAVANGHPDAAEAHPRLARGGHDHRIQLLIEETREGSRCEKVRISWRSEANWPSASLMLLDASASPEITKKTFNGRNVVEHNIDAALNVRTVAVIDSTFSNNAIVSTLMADWKERLHAGKLKDRLRKLLSASSALYGWGRVVVGANVVIRRAIGQSWQPPSNMDFCHYGAMRGLDFAKNHAAAVSLGRMEVPVRTIDGIVAALTYDDPEPEAPFDVTGQSVDPVTGDSLRVPMVDRTIKMRNGSDMTIQMPIYPGHWAKIVQNQYREEELKQFLGRLRPVYRTGPAPVWIACSKVIPEDVIVDTVVSLEDLLRPGRANTRLWDACRLSGGVIHPHVLPAAAPALYKDAEDASKDILRMGFGLEKDAKGSNDWKRRQVWGFTPVRVRGPDQGIATAFVRSDIRDPVAAVREALVNWACWDADTFDVEAGAPNKAYAPSMTREWDSVENDLGSREQRAREEAMLLQKCAEESISRHRAEAFDLYAGMRRDNLPVEVRTVPVGHSDEISMTLDEFASTHSTSMMWHRRLQGHADPALSPVMDLAATYDHLSAGSYEEDGL